jgi:hypothetical protein
MAVTSSIGPVKDEVHSHFGAIVIRFDHHSPFPGRTFW